MTRISFVSGQFFRLEGTHVPSGENNGWGERIVKLYKLKSKLDWSQTWRRIRKLIFQSDPEVTWSLIPSPGKYAVL